MLILGNEVRGECVVRLLCVVQGEDLEIQDIHVILERVLQIPDIKRNEFEVGGWGRALYFITLQNASVVAVELRAVLDKAIRVNLEVFVSCGVAIVELKGLEVGLEGFILCNAIVVNKLEGEVLLLIAESDHCLRPWILEFSVARGVAFELEFLMSLNLEA